MGFKVYLSNNSKLAINLKFDGLYIPAFNRKKIYHKINKKIFVFLDQPIIIGKLKKN